MALCIVEKIEVPIVNGLAKFLLEEVKNPVISDVYVDPRRPSVAVISYQGQEQHTAVEAVQVAFFDERQVAGWDTLPENGSCLGYTHFRTRKLN